MECEILTANLKACAGFDPAAAVTQEETGKLRAKVELHNFLIASVLRTTEFLEQINAKSKNRRFSGLFSRKKQHSISWARYPRQVAHCAA